MIGNVAGNSLGRDLPPPRPQDWAVTKIVRVFDESGRTIRYRIERMNRITGERIEREITPIPLATPSLK